ncbi:hypothetical protein BGZ98_003882 [Dissophora globulifera]|nr:hypothetical protein BGZ98_003882 [Dissophora globulifera]
MGMFSQGVALQNSGRATGPTSLPHSSHRSSLKAPNQVRWPVNLNQLAALSLDDDSDLDRSFTDASRDDIGSVRLLRMLKDSDDESTSFVPAKSRLQRPRSIPQPTQQKPQQQLFQKGGIPVARSSSMQGPYGSPSSTGHNVGLPKPQRSQSDNKGSSAPSGGIKRPTGLRHYQSDASLITPKRQPRNADDMESIFQEANAVAQRLGGSPSAATDYSNRGHERGVPGLRTSGSKNGSIPAPTTRTVAGKALGITSPSGSPSNGGPSQVKSRLSAPVKSLASSPSSALKQRTSLPSTTAARSTGLPRDQREQQREPSSSPRVLGSVSATAIARKTTGLQNSPIPRSLVLKQTVTSPGSNLSTTAIGESEAQRTIRELNEELERWKTEANEYGQQRLEAENWKKQVSILERDLEVALDTLQSAEASVIDAKAQQESTGSKLVEYERTIQGLNTDLEKARAEREKAVEKASSSQKQVLDDLHSRNEELEKKLSQAQQDVDRLELQAVPADVQDMQQALFSATQELEEAKRRIDTLNADLMKEKAKVIREQEDSSHLLSKLSQLQDTISNHIRDNNALKELVKNHEKCQENADVLDYQHRKELEQHQNEIMIHLQSLAQEKEQKSKLEQTLQEHQFQVHQFQQQSQQQMQLQQTQLLQQQTEIVNLRAALEVEQRQTTLLQQRLQEEQRLSNPPFNKRLSIDGDMNGSFFMVETPNGTGINPASIPLSIDPMAGVPTTTSTMMTAGGVAGAQSLSTSSPNTMSRTMANLSSSGMQTMRNFDSPLPSALTSQLNMTAAQTAAAAALPPTAGTPNVTADSMASSFTMEIETKPRMLHRASSSSISSILATGNNNANRISIHGDSVPSTGGATQTVEELTVQLQSLLKQKERLQADLSKIPITGGGPMTRRKADMLEEQMDETERAISKIRYSIRMRS